MSEYMDITCDIDDEGRILRFRTNLVLTTSNPEEYGSVEEMEEGSALAQLVSQVDGIERLIIEENQLIAFPNASSSLYLVSSEITAALKEFFL